MVQLKLSDMGDDDWVWGKFLATFFCRVGVDETLHILVHIVSKASLVLTVYTIQSIQRP